MGQPVGIEITILEVTKHENQAEGKRSSIWMADTCINLIFDDINVETKAQVNI